MSAQYIGRPSMRNSNVDVDPPVYDGEEDLDYYNNETGETHPMARVHTAAPAETRKRDHSDAR